MLKFPHTRLCKTIAVTLVLSFIAYDLSWAYPNDHLSPPDIFRPITAKDEDVRDVKVAVAMLTHGKDVSVIDDPETSPNGVSISFDMKRREEDGIFSIPCTVDGKRRYIAYVTREGEVQEVIDSREHEFRPSAKAVAGTSTVHSSRAHFSSSSRAHFSVPYQAGHGLFGDNEWQEAVWHPIDTVAFGTALNLGLNQFPVVSDSDPIIRAYQNNFGSSIPAPIIAHSDIFQQETRDYALNHPDTKFTIMPAGFFQHPDMVTTHLNRIKSIEEAFPGTLPAAEPVAAGASAPVRRSSSGDSTLRSEGGKGVSPNEPSQDAEKHYMLEVIRYARQNKYAPEMKDLPTAAIIFDREGREISRGIRRKKALGETSPARSIHAERSAIHEAISKGRKNELRGATIAVTLEPCAKCAQLIAENGIGKCIFAMSDIGPVKRPQGLNVLLKAGIDVRRFPELLGRKAGLLLFWPNTVFAPFRSKKTLKEKIRISSKYLLFVFLGERPSISLRSLLHAVEMFVSIFFAWWKEGPAATLIYGSNIHRINKAGKHLLQTLRQLEGFDPDKTISFHFVRPDSESDKKLVAKLDGENKIGFGVLSLHMPEDVIAFIFARIIAMQLRRQGRLSKFNAILAGIRRQKERSFFTQVELQNLIEFAEKEIFETDTEAMHYSMEAGFDPSKALSTIEVWKELMGPESLLDKEVIEKCPFLMAHLPSPEARVRNLRSTLKNGIFPHQKIAERTLFSESDTGLETSGEAFTNGPSPDTTRDETPRASASGKEDFDEDEGAFDIGEDDEYGYLDDGAEDVSEEVGASSRGSGTSKAIVILDKNRPAYFRDDPSGDRLSTREIALARQILDRVAREKGVPSDIGKILEHGSNAKSFYLGKREQYLLLKVITLSDDERLKEACRDCMLATNIGLVIKRARKYCGGDNELRKDLFQVGVIGSLNIEGEGQTGGLLAAIKTFDIKENVLFSTHAVWHIKAAMTREIENYGSSVRRPVHVWYEAKHVKKIRQLLGNRLGRAPTDDELAEELGMGTSDLAKLHNVAQTVESLDKPVSEERDEEVGESKFVPADIRGIDPSNIAEALHIAERCAEVFDATLTALQGRLLLVLHDQHSTLGKVGLKLGVTKERIRQLQEKALKKLRSNLRLKYRDIFEGPDAVMDVVAAVKLAKFGTDEDMRSRALSSYEKDLKLLGRAKGKDSLFAYNISEQDFRFLKDVRECWQKLSALSEEHHHGIFDLENFALAASLLVIMASDGHFFASPELRNEVFNKIDGLLNMSDGNFDTCLAFRRSSGILTEDLLRRIGLTALASRVKEHCDLSAAELWRFSLDEERRVVSEEQMFRLRLSVPEGIGLMGNDPEGAAPADGGEKRDSAPVRRSSSGDSALRSEGGRGVSPNGMALESYKEDDGRFWRQSASGVNRDDLPVGRLKLYEDMLYETRRWCGWIETFSSRVYCRELARRLIREEIPLRIMSAEFRSGEHYWVEVFDPINKAMYILDPLPEELGEEWSNSFKRRDGHPIVILSENSETAEMYEGKRRDDMRDLARSDAADDTGYYQKQMDTLASLADDRRSELYRAGIEPRFIPADEGVLFLQERMEESKMALDRIREKDEEFDLGEWGEGDSRHSASGMSPNGSSPETTSANIRASASGNGSSRSNRSKRVAIEEKLFDGRYRFHVTKSKARSLFREALDSVFDVEDIEEAISAIKGSSYLAEFFGAETISRIFASDEIKGAELFHYLLSGGHSGLWLYSTYPAMRIDSIKEYTRILDRIIKDGVDKDWLKGIFTDSPKMFLYGLDTIGNGNEEINYKTHWFSIFAGRESDGYNIPSLFGHFWKEYVDKLYGFSFVHMIDNLRNLGLEGFEQSLDHLAKASERDGSLSKRRLRMLLSQERIPIERAVSELAVPAREYLRSDTFLERTKTATENDRWVNSHDRFLRETLINIFLLMHDGIEWKLSPKRFSLALFKIISRSRVELWTEFLGLNLPIADSNYEFNVYFLESLGQLELEGILAHEIGHNYLFDLIGPYTSDSDNNLGALGEFIADTFSFAYVQKNHGFNAIDEYAETKVFLDAIERRGSSEIHVRARNKLLSIVSIARERGFVIDWDKFLILIKETIESQSDLRKTVRKIGFEQFVDTIFDTYLSEDEKGSESISAESDRASASGAFVQNRLLFVGDEFFPRQFDVFHDFAEKAPSQILAFMKRHYGGAAIRMPKVDVASFLTNAFETEVIKYANSLSRFKRANSAHQLTSTSWSPTNSNGVSLGRSTSRQSWIASLILPNSVVRFLACVWHPFNAGTLATKTPSSSFSIITKNCFLGIRSLLIHIKDILHWQRSQVEREESDFDENTESKSTNRMAKIGTVPISMETTVSGQSLFLPTFEGLPDDLCGMFLSEDNRLFYVAWDSRNERFILKELSGSLARAGELYTDNAMTLEMFAIEYPGITKNVVLSQIQSQPRDSAGRVAPNGMAPIVGSGPEAPIVGMIHFVRFAVPREIASSPSASRNDYVYMEFMTPYTASIAGDIARNVTAEYKDNLIKIPRAISINVDIFPLKDEGKNDEITDILLEIVAIKQRRLNAVFGKDMVRFEFVSPSGRSEIVGRIEARYQELTNLGRRGSEDEATQGKVLHGFMVTNKTAVEYENYRPLVLDLEGNMSLKGEGAPYMFASVLDLAISLTLLVGQESRNSYYDKILELYAKLVGKEIKIEPDDLDILLGEDLAMSREIAKRLAIPPAARYNVNDVKTFYERMKYALIAA